ncbi:unnamed protein product [Adineta steineri]|uniref:Uncharacterized protein n=1 Tax=Adineta steineri TaxID=433720 RepID=A0A818NSY6_9BILA|nr:unnamed protein product [Adineta steineri]CAF3610765.1 unnamed protein product [Adineta steineri]CAF3627949.1 unnamed protein product [Adineta steineri]
MVFDSSLKELSIQHYLNVAIWQHPAGKEPTTTSTSTTTTTTATAQLSLYGVQLNLDPSSLPSGWSLCYNATYADTMVSTVVATVLSTCNKNKLLLGCRPVANTILTVAAMGNRADVLYNCSSARNCTHVANGVGWYFSDSYSWGFVSGSDTVIRNTCDEGTGDDAYRLCWHTLSVGGYRCGSALCSTDSTWAKVIYHAN